MVDETLFTAEVLRMQGMYGAKNAGMLCGGTGAWRME